MSEKSLHAALKRWYAQPGDAIEARVDGYVIDLVRGELLIEIQTASFHAIKRKLAQLLDSHPVRLVHPIALEKWIVRTSPKGRKVIGRRKSPKRGCVDDVYAELVSIPRLVAHPNFSLELIFVRVEEARRKDGRGSRRRHGWSVHDRTLLEVVESRVLAAPADFRALLPEGLPAPFTTADLAQARGVSVFRARQQAYCLREMGAIAVVGQRGKAWLYV